MKNQLTALTLAAVTALSLTPKPAQASDRGLAVLGGFIGGMIVGSVINENRHDSYPQRRTTVIVADRDDRCEERRDSGYWEDITVQAWVPGCWVFERGYHGRSYRRYVGGHYEYRTDRVWVSSERHGGQHRETGYGYGHRR